MFTFRPMNNDEQRYCKGCETTFPLTAEYFHKKKAAKGGFQYLCKPCMCKCRSVSWRAAKARKKEKKARKQAEFINKYKVA